MSDLDGLGIARLVISSPVRLDLIGFSNTEIEYLTQKFGFVNTQLSWQLKKLKQNRWFKEKNPEGFHAAINDLETRSKGTMIWKDDVGHYTLPGLAYLLQEIYPGIQIENKVVYPEKNPLPWGKAPLELRYYQKDIVNKLSLESNAAISCVTGGGKSACILQLVRDYGLSTLVLAPSVSIAEQLYDLFKEMLGGKWVGFFGAGKKESHKRIVIAIGASVTKVQPGDEHWDNLSQKQLLCVDEAHRWVAQTLQDVCLGICKNTPYRYFFSATQMRNDGQTIVLKALTGPIVYQYDTAQAVQDGFLSPLEFKIVEVPKNSYFYSDDALELAREHLYYNPKVITKAIDIANKALENGRKVLILLEEINQFSKLYPGLSKWGMAFAHGGNLNQEQKDLIPSQFHKSDANECVQGFNDLKYPLLIGTSCISEGTDTKAVDYLIYLQGGKSEIQVKQAVGRGTRIFPGKKECVVVDFDIFNCKILNNQTKVREKIYSQLGDVKRIKSKE